MNKVVVDTVEIDEYVIKDNKIHKIAVICPGGGYEYISDFNEGEPVANKLNAMGISAFVIHYRCGDKAKYPAPMDDLAKAISYIVEKSDEYNLDFNTYSIWGFSAGGHLVSSFGTKILGYEKYNVPKPQVLILSYPVISMGECGHGGSRNNLLGLDATKEMIESMSVENIVDEDYPRTFVWTGLSDETVSPINSKLLKDSLEKYNVNVKYIEYENVGHGVGLGKGLACEDWFENAIEFWMN